MTALSRKVSVVSLCAALGLFVWAWPVSAEETEASDVTPQAEQSLETAQAELIALLHYFLENSGAEEAHAKFWADDLIYTSSNGTRFGKQDIMAGFANSGGADGSGEEDAGASDAPDVVFTGEDVNVQVFGTTAIVTFRLVGTPDDGSEPKQYFNSGTFLKRQGRWQAVNWQATIIPQEAT